MHDIKLLWHSRFYYLRTIATTTIFLALIAFIQQTKIELSLVWLLWCWNLLNSGARFWEDEQRDNAWLHWLDNCTAINIINQKFIIHVIFNAVIWLITWMFWLLFIDYNQNMLWLALLIMATTPIIMGVAVLISSLSASIISNSNLLSFITLPLLVPIMVYGSGACVKLELGQDPSHIIAGMSALAMCVGMAIPRLVLLLIREVIKLEL